MNEAKTDLKLVEIFTMQDGYNWPIDQVMEEANAIAARQGEMYGFTVGEVKLAKDQPPQGDGFKLYRFEVYGTGESPFYPEHLSNREDTTGPVSEGFEPASAPFEQDVDASDQITVSMLRDMLNRLPSELNDYAVKYDGACGRIYKRDFTVIPGQKAISING
jgi:hypothetical protein